MARIPTTLFALSVFVLCQQLGCSGLQKTKKQNPSARPKSQLRAVAAATLSEEADRDRRRLVKEELDQFFGVTLTFDASKLSSGDRRLLKTLLSVANVVETINLLQANPKALIYRQQIKKEGTSDDQTLFFRNHGPWCLSKKDVRCNALRSMPPKEIGAHFWPNKMTPAEHQRILKAPNRKQLLSPFTLVRRRGMGFEPIPMINDTLFRKQLERLSRLLERAAELASEPTLKTYLRARAKAFLSKKDFPYDQSDLDWSKLKGKWEVTVGPYETRRSPYGIKARFGIYIGLLDPELSQQLDQYLKSFKTMNTWLSVLVGRKLYKPKGEPPKTTIRAVQMVMAAGDARRAQAAVVSYHLPNRGKAIKNGVNKKVIMVNHIRSFTPLIKTRATLVLDPKLVQYVTEEANILNAMFHELSYEFGARDDEEARVEKSAKSRKGKKITIANALGSKAQLIKKLKAHAVGLWLIGKRRQRGKVSEIQFRAQYTTAFIKLLVLLQDDLSRSSSQAAALLIGSLVENKAALFKDGQWRLNFRKMRWTFRKLAKKVMTIQLRGDKKTARKLFYQFFSEKRAGIRLKDFLDQPRLKCMEKFIKAGIKNVTLAYKVTNLRVEPIQVAKPKNKTDAVKKVPGASKKKEDATKKALPKKESNVTKKASSEKTGHATQKALPDKKLATPKAPKKNAKAAKKTPPPAKKSPTKKHPKKR